MRISDWSSDVSSSDLRPSAHARHPDTDTAGTIGRPTMSQAQAARDPNAYFVPHHSRWPLFASVALFVTRGGLASWFNEASYGKATFFVGIAGMIVILFKWFADVILESEIGRASCRERVCQSV